jgi:hypothetical protein
MVAASKADFEGDLDRLYQLPLSEFTSAREELAKRLRAQGEREKYGATWKGGEDVRRREVHPRLRMTNNRRRLRGLRPLRCMLRADLADVPRASSLGT